MRKSKLLICGLLLASCLTPCTRFLNEEKAKNICVNAVYGTGDVVEIPKKTLTYNLEQKEVEGYVVFPNGETYKGVKFTPTVPGIYKIIYETLFGDHLEKQEETITVLNYGKKLFTNSSSGGSITYGSASENSCVPSSLKGVILEAGSQSVFTFNKIIDLNALSADDYFIEGIMLPKTQGKADCGAFTITLTDIEDENEAITISCKDSTLVNDGGRGMYVLSKTTNQRFGGLEGDSKYHNDGNWGSLFHSSFLGLPLDGINFPFRFYFNKDELAIYGYPSNSHGKSLNNDFNSNDFYGYNLWNGFPSGKVKIEITLSNLVGSSAKMLISSIGGINLGNDLLEDTEAPYIKIDKGNSSLPSGEINKKYNIFPAIVSDNLFDGITYNTYVTYKDIASGTDVDVESTTEYFIPKKAGTYTIHYIAVDNFGNKSEEKIDILINQDIQHIFLDVDTTPIDAELFSNVEIIPLENIKGYGGNSDLILEYNVYDSEFKKVEVKDNNLLLEKLGKYYIVYSATDYIGNVGYATIKVNCKAPDGPKAKNTIRPRKAYMKGLAYELDCVPGFEVNDGVVYDITPKILVNGTETNSFIANGTSTNVKYIYEGKTGRTKEYSFNIPVRDGNNGGAIDQYFIGENYEAETHQDFTLFKSNSDFEATFANPINAAVFSFAFTFNNNKTNFDYFTLKLTNYLNTEESVTFYFKRVSNNACKVKIGLDGSESIVNSGSGLFKITYNSFEGKLYNDAGIDIGLATKSDNGQLLSNYAGAFVDIGLVGVYAESEIKINELCSQQMGHGQPFRCNTCKKSYNESSLVNGCCPVHTSEVLAPNLNQDNFDYIDPSVYFDGSLPGVVDAGASIRLPKVYAFDVLNYISTKEITISYKRSNNENTYEVIKQCDVDELEEYKFENPGVYLIVYNIYDNVSNDFSYRKIINSYENVAPTLTVDKMKAAYKVNSEIQIPNYHVSDNSQKWTAEVYLYLPNDEMRLLLIDEGGQITSLLEMNDQTYPSNFKVSGNNKAFKVLTKGNYRLKIVAYDAYYNRVSNVQTFNVR